jgi:hypothetical protein
MSIAQERVLMETGASLKQIFTMQWLKDLKDKHKIQIPSEITEQLNFHGEIDVLSKMVPNENQIKFVTLIDKDDKTKGYYEG